MIVQFAVRSLVFSLSVFVLGACSSVSLPSLPWSSKPVVQPNATAEALFEQGMADFNNKKYVRAIDSLQKIREQFPFSPQVADADLKIAEAYYLNQQYPEAIAAFKEFQTLHPTHENIPSVVYHLGLAHLDQFTATDRDQKNTEIAKGYFETVIRNYPNSPHMPPARAKLAQCLEYLAEHEFGIASYYLREEKYPAARDRFEGIVRNYPRTNAAPKALYHLGESYRMEKNPLKAALAYQAFIQHHPDDPLVATAHTRLNEVSSVRQDPLAMLLMRDRRPAQPSLPEETQSQAKNINDLTLVSKTDVVHEEPGSDRGIVLRAIDTINPFAPSRAKNAGASNNGDGVAQKPKDKSSGAFGSLWTGLNPFSKEEKTKPEGLQGASLVGRIDESLKEKGTTVEKAQVQVPIADLPKVEDPPAPPIDTAKLAGDIDARLSKQGKEVDGLPPVPEIAPALNAPYVAKRPTETKDGTLASASATGLIADIDKGLKRKGIEASKASLIPVPTPPEQERATLHTERQEAKNKVELDPKLPVERGPLFLEPGAFAPQETDSKAEEKAQEPPSAPTEIPQAVVTGPAQLVKAPAIEPNSTGKSTGDEEEDDQSLKSALDRIREDVKAISTLLNPFSW